MDEPDVGRPAAALLARGARNARIDRYKQPVTRGDIEQVRGVAVNSNMVRALLERDWIRVVGYREVPGRPAMYGTTKTFLDYFNLKSLDELPTLPEIRALIEPIEAELAGAGPEYVEGPRVEFPSDKADAEAAADSMVNSSTHRARNRSGEEDTFTAQTLA